MRRSVLITLSVALATACASGQQPSPPQPQTPATTSPEQAATPPAQATAPPGAVKVYAPKSGVKAPRLLPMNPPLVWTKRCINNLDDEVELSLLVDTSGMARNIMFLRPTGSAFDSIAIQLAGVDRFEPGTLDGKPVVVAQTLKMQLETCVSQSKDDAGADYTPAKHDVSGVCKVSLVVDAHGMPENVRVLKSLDTGLDRSAAAAVEKYRFFPAIQDEQPVPAAIVVDVSFAPPELQ